MTRTMLKSKIHRATITDSDPHDVARFETYTIAGERGTGEIRVNGAAARLVHDGDTIIVISYASYSREELEHHEPRVVHVDRANAIIDVDSAVATLLTPQEA
jgi:aspartate 1-decarboxylase